MLNAAEQRRQAFSIWLRTGRVAGTAGGSRELKFNPWHDTKDGRFTFSGAGRYFGPGDRSVSPGKGQNKPRIVFTPDPGKPRLTNREEVDAWAAGLLKDHGNERGFPEAIEAQRQRYLLDLTRNQPSPVPLAPPRGALSKVADFATGFRDGVADVGKATATGLYALATTNPATSAKNIGSGIAHAIDAAIAAEDTPAYVQLRRAAHAVANASSHDVGHAFGTLVGSGTLAAAPGAIVSKLSSANRVGRAAAVIEGPSADVISKSGSIGIASEATTGVESGSFSWIHKERYTTNAKLRREWEQQRGTPWPEDAAGRKYEVSHEIALGDGGLDHVVNIYPRTRADHIQRHIDAGDFSRWAKRRTK